MHCHRTLGNIDGQILFANVSTPKRMNAIFRHKDCCTSLLERGGSVQALAALTVGFRVGESGSGLGEKIEIVRTTGVGPSPNPNPILTSPNPHLNLTSRKPSPIFASAGLRHDREQPRRVRNPKRLGPAGRVHPGIRGERRDQHRGQDSGSRDGRVAAAQSKGRAVHPRAASHER